MLLRKGVKERKIQRKGREEKPELCCRGRVGRGPWASKLNCLCLQAEKKSREKAKIYEVS